MCVKDVLSSQIIRCLQGDLGFVKLGNTHKSDLTHTDWHVFLNFPHWEWLKYFSILFYSILLLFLSSLGYCFIIVLPHLRLSWLQGFCPLEQTPGRSLCLWLEPGRWCQSAWFPALWCQACCPCLWLAEWPNTEIWPHDPTDLGSSHRLCPYAPRHQSREVWNIDKNCSGMLCVSVCSAVESRNWSYSDEQNYCSMILV